MKTLKSSIYTTLTVIIFTVLPLVLFTMITSKTSALGNIRSFTVLTGSMTPTLPVGSIIYVQKASHYKIGDIIAFKRDNLTVTHRIIGSRSTNGYTEYATKGDANNAVDSKTVASFEVIGKEYVSVPYIGRATAFFKTIPGFLLFIIFPTLMFIGFEIKNIKEEMERQFEQKYFTRVYMDI